MPSLVINVNPFSAFNVARLPEIRFGSGVFDDLPELIEGYGRQVLLVTGSRSLQQTPRWQNLIDALAHKGIAWQQVIVDGEPSPELVDDAVARITPASRTPSSASAAAAYWMPPRPSPAC